MELFDTTHSALERAMHGASLRQATLAENLANANTPRYQRRDVSFHDALRSALVGGKEALETVEVTPIVDTEAPLRADGSNVDVDREAAELAKSGLEHEALVTVARARTDILRTAMGVA
ncbi:MAG: flagellar basal body rod protein FlgB [Actinomycetota bacterium]|jgi:flagellar basal-body rod protein FlgB|nr:flagellar basal body rod protein FlgB [Actinomycetota bacterium]